MYRKKEHVRGSSIPEGESKDQYVSHMFSPSVPTRRSKATQQSPSVVLPLSTASLLQNQNVVLIHQVGNNQTSSPLPHTNNPCIKNKNSEFEAPSKRENLNEGGDFSLQEKSYSYNRLPRSVSITCPTESLLNHLKSMRRCPLHCDLNIQIRSSETEELQNEIQCHSFVVLQQCQFIASLLESQSTNPDNQKLQHVEDDESLSPSKKKQKCNTEGGKCKVVVLKTNLKNEIIEQVINSFYGEIPEVLISFRSGKNKSVIQDIISFIGLSLQWKLDGLSRYIIHEMFSTNNQLDLEIVFTLLKISEIRNFNLLRRYCLRYIKKNLGIAVNRSEIEQLSKETLIDLLRSYFQQTHSDTNILDDNCPGITTLSMQALLNLKNMKDLQEHNVLPNVIRICTSDGKYFYSYIPLLTVASGFFSTLFGGSYVDSERRELILENIDADTMEMILHYTHGMNVEINSEISDNGTCIMIEKLKKLSYAANWLQMDELLKTSLHELEKRADEKNCLHLLQLCLTLDQKCPSVSSLNSRCCNLLRKTKNSDQLIDIIKNLL